MYLQRDKLLDIYQDVISHSMEPSKGKISLTCHKTLVNSTRSPSLTHKLLQTTLFTWMRPVTICFVYLFFSLFLEVSHGAAALTHFSLTHITATLLTHSTAIVLTHSIAILIVLPHWCSIYSGQSCILFFS